MSRRRGYCERCDVVYEWSHGRGLPGAGKAGCSGCGGRLSAVPKRYEGRSVVVETIRHYNRAAEGEMLSGIAAEFEARRQQRAMAGNLVDELVDYAAARSSDDTQVKRCSRLYRDQAKARCGHDPIADMVNARLVSLQLDVADLARIVEPDENKIDSMRVRLSRWLSGTRPITSEMLCRVLAGVSLKVSVGGFD